MFPELMIVGESPSLNPRAKAILYDALLDNDISEDSFSWVNVLRDAPPDGKNVTKTMIKGSRQRVLDRIEKRDPRFVLLLGNSACQAVLDQAGIRKLRGKPLERDGRIYVPIYHPHQALHDDKWVSVITGDIRRMKECMNFGGIPEEKGIEYHVVDTWDKVEAMLKDLHGKIAIDLETSRLYPFTTVWDKAIEAGTATKAMLDAHKATHGSNNIPKVVAMQFGCNKRQWVVPMETAGIWDHETLVKIVKLVTLKIKNGCFTIFHNGKFDALWMRVRFGVKWPVHFDTMLAHYLLDENDMHGLKYLAQKLMGAYDWDIEGKEKTDWSMENAKYAAHDVYYTRLLYFIFRDQLFEEGDVKKVFKHILMPCVAMFVDAEFTGVHIDLDHMDEAEKVLRDQVADAMTNLSEWGSKAKLVDKKTGVINWASSDQLGDLLFNVLKIKPIEKTKKGKNSVSESVLLRIDHPMVGDLIKYRAAQKQLSSFIDGWRPYLDLDGRLHPVFKLHGTVTGRLSCEHPNLQQVPRDPRIRSLITAPNGWTLIEMDLSQVELRIAAELANEYHLLSVFKSGGDPHWQTAIREIERGAGYKKEVLKTARVLAEKERLDHVDMNYSEAIEYILNKGNEACEEVMIMWKETRKKAKAINFGYLYGMWWKKFKIYARDNYGVDVNDGEAEASREAFFELYPAFLAWHNKQRRFAQLHGYVKSLTGRKRRLPAASLGRDCPERREAQRQAINSPVQSYANDHNLMAALDMAKEFNRNWFRIVGTVHDAILMWVRDDKVEHVYNRGLEIMSSPSLLTTFEISLSVPIEADAKIGPWSKGKNLKKWLAENNNQSLQQKVA